MTGAYELFCNWNHRTIACIQLNEFDMRIFLVLNNSAIFRPGLLFSIAFLTQNKNKGNFQ